jgi:hypothetical protein
LNVRAIAEFAVSLNQAVQEWAIVSAEMLLKPFAAIAIADFGAILTTIRNQATELQSNAKINYLILNELVARVEEIFPYLIELQMLAKGKMQVWHWNALFDECQQPNEYHSQIAIGDVLSLGILKMREKIIRITATSQGESELEVKFQQITSDWNKVLLPIIEQTTRSEDNLMLGSTDALSADSCDTITTLQNMLALPFVQGVREAVPTLLSTLEDIPVILEA